MKLTGYASVFNYPYEVAGYTESIAPKAFSASLRANPDVALLINHGEGGSGMPLARTKSGTMRLSEDSKGLAVDADLDEQDPDVQLLVSKIKRGLLDQMSFAFRATDQTWNADFTERRILSADIHRGDVSVVNQGASDATSVSVRAGGMCRPARTFAQRKAVAQAVGDRVELRGARLSVTKGGFTVVRRRVNYDLRIARQKQLVAAAASAEDRARTPVSVLVSPLTRQTCPICNGDGVVDPYGEGPRDCRNCDGLGHVSVLRTPNGVPAMFTGPDRPSMGSAG